MTTQIRTDSSPGYMPKDSATLPAQSVTREDPEQFRRDLLHHLLYNVVKEPPEAAPVDFCRAMALSVRDRLVERWLATQKTYLQNDVKRVNYLSAEFLTGRSLGLCLVNLGLYRTAHEVAHSMGHDLGEILDAEGDPGLGNGGLGRLAACFMDSLATLDLPAVGYGIRYEHGIFEQRIEAGQQVEYTDNWLQFGNPWELTRHDRTQVVRFYGSTEIRRDAQGRMVVEWVNGLPVLGVPHDSFIVGHETDNVNTLRLWSARASHDFDLRLFNQGDYLRAVEEKVEVENISKVLYPNDQTEHGKELRLKQQYFFVACSIADILSDFKRAGHKDLRLLPERAAIQLNDTHPSIAVAELMRVMIDEERLDWDTAWDITQRTVGYTNHTLMPEALERWPAYMLQRVLPRHLMLIYEINQRFMRQVSTHWPTDPSRMTRMSIIEEGPVQHVRMAHLAVLGSHSVNGVAKLHTELIKHQLLPDFYELFPERFNNKTNGVTPRRWFLYSNYPLAKLLAERFGPKWIDEESEHKALLEKNADDVELLDKIHAIKLDNKVGLASMLQRLTGVAVNPEAMFIAQIKRIHEYKRQLLACVEAIAHYLYLKALPPGSDETPRVYIFAGKAAAGYATAKMHIRLINDVAAVINADPETSAKLKIVFVPNYGVSLAQAIIPAIDVSLQISQAGKEASGTSNMKLALNGALTVGTLDGANVEIRENVGTDNFFLCGHTLDQVQELQRTGYDPKHFIAQSPPLAQAIAMIESGFFSLGEGQRYLPVVNYLRDYDPYMVCADFDSFASEMRAAAALFRSPRPWTRRSLFNIVGGSAFSSDTTIRAYAREIWNLVPVKAKLQSSDATTS
ncbi:MAG TPA: glycogen/starch/alpha-glucan phosphorylase [Polyangiaceae bacterium]|nr:glycogen/starch/alpha-glucan phosphorylase [Polyangiaceae bacterium]